MANRKRDNIDLVAMHKARRAEIEVAIDDPNYISRANKIRERQRRWYQENKEKRKIYQHAYMLKNKEKRNLYARKYRAMLKESGRLPSRKKTLTEDELKIRNTALVEGESPSPQLSD